MDAPLTYNMVSPSEVNLENKGRRLPWFTHPYSCKGRIPNEEDKQCFSVPCNTWEQSQSQTLLSLMLFRTTSTSGTSSEFLIISQAEEGKATIYPRCTCKDSPQLLNDTLKGTLCMFTLSGNRAAWGWGSGAWSQSGRLTSAQSAMLKVLPTF